MKQGTVELMKKSDRAQRQRAAFVKLVESNSAQFPGQGYLVNGLIPLEQRHAGRKANLIFLSVKVLGFDHVANP